MSARETVINSRDNRQVRAAREVRDGKQRELIFIEGKRLCAEAISAGLIVEEAFLTEELARNERHEPLHRELLRSGCRTYLVSERVLDSIADTKTPQGIVLIARRPAAQASALEKAINNTTLLVILHRVGNPSNAGSVLRTAEAAGACGAIITTGTVDIFSPKALRGAMGSSFRLPVWAGAEYAEALAWCRARGIAIVATNVRASRSYSDFDWTNPSALVVGAEASGLTIDEAAQADEAVSIPMRAPVESLNVGVAAAVVLYEAARQRNSF